MSRPRKGAGPATVGFSVRVNFDPGTRLEDLLEDASGIMESVAALLDNLTGQQPSQAMMCELFGAWHLARLAKAFVERASYQAIREAEGEGGK